VRTGPISTYPTPTLKAQFLIQTEGWPVNVVRHTDNLGAVVKLAATHGVQVRDPVV